MSKLTPADQQRARKVAHEIFRKKTLGGLRSRRLSALVKPPAPPHDPKDDNADLLDGAGLEGMMSMYDEDKNGK
jgi:hypothetical protein